MKKEYSVSDLFFTSWKQLKGPVHAAVYALYLKLQTLQKDSPQYGFVMIALLRQLRRRPLVVDSVNVEQAVDIFNDLTFLTEPWYYFPEVITSAQSKQLGLQKPHDHLSKCTFDHFIYADNEFSSYLVTWDDKHLTRLVATLYQAKFDKEAVDTIAKALPLDQWQKDLVFYTFGHIREFVMKRCKTLLPPSIPSEEEVKPRSTGAMWLKIKHRLAETAAFQGYDTAGSGNMYSTLDYLEDLAQIREDQRR
jgi:hypothetical protein